MLAGLQKRMGQRGHTLAPDSPQQASHLKGPRPDISGTILGKCCLRASSSPPQRVSPDNPVMVHPSVCLCACEARPAPSAHAGSCAE